MSFFFISPTVEEVSQIIIVSTSIICDPDPVSPTLLKAYFNYLLRTITHVINVSLRSTLFQIILVKRM